MSVVGRTLLVSVLSGNLLMLLCGAVSDGWVDLNIEKLHYLINAGNNLTFYVYIPMFIGQIIGAFLFSLLSDIIGRKYTLLIATFPLIVGLLLTEFFYDHGKILAFGRSLTGLFVGATHSVLPVYLSEISEAYHRGKIITSLFTSYFVGILIDTTMSFLRATPLILTIIGIFLAVVFCVMFILVAPESPYYCLNKFQTNKMEISLNKLRRAQVNTQYEIDDMQRKPDENKYDVDDNESLIARLNLPPWIKSCFIVLNVVVLNVFIGVTIRLEFITSIFEMDMKILKTVVGLSVLLRIVASCFCLFLVDNIGRKVLLMISYGGAAVSSAFFLMAVCLAGQNDYVLNMYLVAFSIVALDVFSALGAYPISFLLIGELFSLRRRMLGSAIFTAFYFGSYIVLMYATVALLFIRIGLIVWYLLVIFCSIAMIITVKIFYLETKDMSLQQIQISLNKKKIIKGHRLDVETSYPLIRQSQF